MLQFAAPDFPTRGYCPDRSEPSGISSLPAAKTHFAQRFRTFPENSPTVGEYRLSACVAEQWSGSHSVCNTGRRGISPPAPCCINPYWWPRSHGYRFSGPYPRRCAGSHAPEVRGAAFPADLTGSRRSHPGRSFHRPPIQTVRLFPLFSPR